MAQAASPFDGFRKRNRMVVSFQVSKIENAIARAAEVVARKENSDSEKGLPRRVTERVIEELNNPLCEYYVFPDENGKRIPAIEDVQDLVEIVLSELGYSAVVAAYKRYRKQRERARRRIRVRGGDNGGDVDVTDASLLLVHSVDRNETLPWDRSHITQQLLEKTDLSDEVAISVAKSVENRVIASDLEALNTTLIRELVNNELADRGYDEQLHDLSLYRVPRDFVDRLMFTKTTENSNIVNNNPETVNLGLADLLLKQ